MIFFEEWLIGILVKEAVEFYGGKKRGWEKYDNVDRIPSWWWKWLHSKLNEDPNIWVPKIVVDGQEWSRDQVVNHILRMAGGTSVPQPQPQPQTQTPQQPQKPIQPQQSQQGKWILATAKIDETLEDQWNVPHKINKGEFVALTDNGDGTWTYVTIYKGKPQWYNSDMPKDQLSQRFQRVTDNKGNMIRGNSPRELAKSTYQEPNKKDFKLTEEQEDILNRFKEMKESKKSDHMVISALAGTGKTSSLKKLAEKFGKRGEKWLYLVFGAKNREEAIEEFPKFVDVFTTNSYAGQVLESNKIKPTDRMVNYSKETKIDKIIDGPQYQQVVNSLNIPYFDDPSVNKYIKGYLKSIWTEFNKEVSKLTGLAKAYNIGPENAIEGIKQIASEHDINSELERTKERLEKDPNVDFMNEQLSDEMGISNFLREDFLDRMIRAASWVLEKSVPHGIDQEFLQTHERKKVNNREVWQRLQQPIKRNLRTVRDFDDDLWYAAQHADELDWTKPKHYQYVLVDEVQDFNKAQKVILKKLIDAGAKIVAVGDPRQSLFRFRGADDEAFNDITEMLKNASANPDKTSKTLTKNWRSKPGLIDYSNKNTVVKNLQAGREHDPKDPTYISDYEVKYDDAMARLGHEMEVLGEMKTQTAFISRTNEPLAKAAMDLLKNKIPFVIYGKDLANEIIGLINRVLGWQKYRSVNDDSDLESFKEELDGFVKDKTESWSGKAAKSGQMRDLIEAQKALHSSLEVLGQSNPDATVSEFKDWLYSRLGGIPDNLSQKKKAELKSRLEKENPVILTTAHRAKGLEFDRVYEITPSLYPHPKAKLPKDLDQEDNARYVAATRARDEYHILDDSGKDSE